MDGRGWWDAFYNEFETSRLNPRTEVGMAYEFVRRRPDLPESDAGWTQIMGVFLARLAQQAGLTQAWEVERPYGSGGKGGGALDLGWYSGKERHPSVIIEHESWLPEMESIKSRKAVYLKILPKLGAAPANLRVLLTYVKADEVKQRVVSELSGLFAALKAKGEWFLGLGPYGSSELERWHGFVMSDDSELVPLQ